MVCRRQMDKPHEVVSKLRNTRIGCSGNLPITSQGGEAVQRDKRVKLVKREEGSRQ